MTTLLMSSFCVFLWILNVLKVRAEDQVSSDFVTILTASCRASCLDEFVPALSTVENCQKNHDCSMCSQICRMFHEDLHMWKPMCTNKDICFPGCRKACAIIEQKKDIRSTSTSEITIHSFYDPVRHLVKLIWSPVTEGVSSIFYVILLKNRLSQNRTWTEFAQTTSCTMHMKPELLNQDTDIRIMAANSNGQIADTVISYSYSLLSDRSNLSESKYAIANEKDLLSILKHRLKNANK